MKILAAASLLLFTVSCAMAGAQEVVMRTVAQGAYGTGVSGEREALLATDAAAFEKLWSARVGNQPVPAVDFSREAAILLTGGEHSTGGWSVVPRSVRLENSVLVVEAVLEGPPPGSMSTQVLTYPWALIAVSPKSFESVRWETARVQ